MVISQVSYRTNGPLVLYTEQKKKRNNRPPRIFEFMGKTLIISGLFLYDSHSWDIWVQLYIMQKKLIFISIKIE